MVRGLISMPSHLPGANKFSLEEPTFNSGSVSSIYAQQQDSRNKNQQKQQTTEQDTQQLEVGQLLEYKMLNVFKQTKGRKILIYKRSY